MVPARLLDLTRLVSRLGKGPATGIDRVESAYLAEFLARDSPVFGLVRSAVGFLLLDRAAMQMLQDGDLDLRHRDLIGRLALRGNRPRAAAETALRQLALARAPRWRLARLLARHLPRGSTYFNTGHANLDDSTLAAIRQGGLRIAVLVHDTIPLDHPEFARPDTIARFRRKMQAVARHADVVIHTSHATRVKTEAQFARLGHLPESLVAPLGVPLPMPDVAALSEPPPQAPYYVCLGTIEPRKNHALLLDVWERLPPPVPGLYLLGRRGWSNAVVFARLDALPPDGPIREIAGLSDGAVATLLSGATALLFPSQAEGFGLPALEAAALGVPVIASNLAVFRELLGEFPIYLDIADSYSWLETIARLAQSGPLQRVRMDPPTWQAHFNIVLSRL